MRKPLLFHLFVVFFTSFPNLLMSNVLNNYPIENVQDMAVKISYDDAHETVEFSDLIISEVMFNHPEEGAEYVEFYNRSEKLLDCSGLVFTTRKADGSLNTGVKFPVKTYMPPASYLAVTADVEAVRTYHQCPDDAVLIELKLSALNNTSAHLVLTNSTKDLIYDEFQYHDNMHHVLIKNTKGVALERIYVDRPTQDENNWHSAAAVHQYGSPGFQNSQYRDEYQVIIREDEFFYLENECFTPDNDGLNDVCVIHYEFPEAGYVFSAQILSPIGEKVYMLAEQHLAENCGILIWDGRNCQGRIANIGIYILYVQLIHPDKAIRKTLKYPIVLSA